MPKAAKSATKSTAKPVAESPKPADAKPPKPQKYVLALMKALPEDVDSDLDKLLAEIKAKLPEKCEVVKAEKEPIAFGLTAWKLQVKIPADMPGGSTPVEDAMMAVPGIQRAETEMVSNYST